MISIFLDDALVSRDATPSPLQNININSYRYFPSSIICNGIFQMTHLKLSVKLARRNAICNIFHNYVF